MAFVLNESSRYFAVKYLKLFQSKRCLSTYKKGTGAAKGKNRNDLIQIPSNQWPLLKQLYTKDWPSHVLSSYAIQNYIRWADKHPMMDDVQISSIDNKWLEHGVFMLEDRNDKRYNVIFNALDVKKHKNLLLELLRYLDPDPPFTFTAFVDSTLPVVLDYLKDLNVEFTKNNLTTANVFFMPKQHTLTTGVGPLLDYDVRPLNRSFIMEINNAWIHKHPGSKYLLERIICFNLTFGLFKRKSNVLCGWIVQDEIGTMGILQVTDELKAQGLADYLIRLLAFELAKEGMDAVATVSDTNMAATKLFTKMAYKVIHKAYWFDKPALGNKPVGPPISIKKVTNALCA